MSLTLDVVSHYAFGKSLGLVERPEFSPQWKEVIKMAMEGLTVVRNFPWLETVMEALPDSIASKISNKTVFFRHVQEVITFAS